MASSNSVKILEVTRVSPSCSDSPNSLAEFFLPLTFFDAFWIKFPLVERLFLYRHTESTRSSFDSVILPRLKHSLSLTLCHYLPLAGHLTWDPLEPKPTILYSPNDGVSLTVAESTTDLTRLCSDETHEATELRPLIPELSISDHKASALSLQITLFPGQGFSVGITSHHAVVDSQTLTTFIKAWTHICKQEQEQEREHLSLPQDLSPLFDRSVVKDPIGLDAMVLLNWWLGYTGANSDPSKKRLKLLPSPVVDPDSVRATFELTREDIKNLRERVLQNDVVKQNSKPLHYFSTFVLAYAYMLTSMVNARGGDSNRNVCFGFTADYRTRLDPPIPLNYFGNCNGTEICIATAGDFMEENGFALAAEKMRAMVSGLDKGVLERAHETLSKIFTTFNPGTQAVSVAGSTRFGVYGSDFGWGKPRKAEIVSIDKTGAFSMAESRDGSGGVEISLCLNRHEMDIFASVFVDGLKDIYHKVQEASRIAATT